MRTAPDIGRHLGAILFKAEGQELLILLNSPPWKRRGEPSEVGTNELISLKERAEMFWNQFQECSRAERTLSNVHTQHIASFLILQNQVDRRVRVSPSASITESVSSSFLSPILAFAEGCQSMRTPPSISQDFFHKPHCVFEKPVLGKSFTSPKELECSHCSIVRMM